MTHNKSENDLFMCQINMKYIIKKYNIYLLLICFKKDPFTF